MSTFYVENNQIKDGYISILGDDYRHIKNVLRCKIGEKLDICDENAVRYKTKINKYIEDEVVCEIETIDENSTESPINITLFQGLPKSDKLELIIQQATEMGASSVYPVQMERSIVKIDEKSIDKKLDRWNKIAVEASKQSGRQKVLKVHRVINLKNIIENISKYDIVLLPYENEKSATIKDTLKSLLDRKVLVNDIAVIIGPEGGFSDEEVSTLNKFENVHTVTLGPRILRTETAGLATLAMLIYEFEL